MQIIAEIGSTHGGSLANALRLVEAAADAGATAVKTQCLWPESLTLDHDGPGFIIRGGLWDGRRLIDLYREIAIPMDWQPKLRQRAKDRGIKFGASVFCNQTVDFMASLKPDFLKIASFEAIDVPLVRYAASTGYPMVISLGMVNSFEISRIRGAVKKVSGLSPTFLVCPPGYPAPVGRGQFYMPNRPTHWGLSDHSAAGTRAAKMLGAFACQEGAVMIERHLKLPDVQTPDDKFSSDPTEFAEIVANIELAQAICGSAGDRHEPQRDLRRSIYAVAPIKKGEPLTKDNIRSIRPGYGMPPWRYPSILGRTAARDIPFGHPISMEDVGK